jgi:O-acetyl-ADP-ribose deacetylase
LRIGADSMREAGGMEIRAVRTDIVTLAVDAVINAANAELRRGAGVCGAIFSGAGPELDAACAAIGACDPGDAVVTPGFDLPARWIIHTVGPVWHDGTSGEADLLASCYRRSLEVATEMGARSVAFPAISTGVYGYPPDEAAEIAVGTLRSSPVTVDEITLVAFDDETLERYRSLLEQG